MKDILPPLALEDIEGVELVILESSFENDTASIASFILRQSACQRKNFLPSGVMDNLNRPCCQSYSSQQRHFMSLKYVSRQLYHSLSYSTKDLAKLHALAAPLSHWRHRQS